MKLVDQRKDRFVGVAPGLHDRMSAHSIKSLNYSRAARDANGLGLIVNVRWPSRRISRIETFVQNAGALGVLKKRIALRREKHPLPVRGKRTRRIPASASSLCKMKADFTRVKKVHADGVCWSVFRQDKQSKPLGKSKCILTDCE